MSSREIICGSVRIEMAIERTACPRFKQIFSPKDLAEVYTPTLGERLAVHRCTKGRVGEVGFLALLKTYQCLEHFVPLSEVPYLLHVVCEFLVHHLHAEHAVISEAGHFIPATGKPYNERLRAFLRKHATNSRH